MGKARFYTLDANKQPIPCDLAGWSAFLLQPIETRRVGYAVVGAYTVSTVFLGLDHSFSDQGPPILFETILFVKGKSSPDYLQFHRRFATWSDAELHHIDTVFTLTTELTPEALATLPAK